MKRKGALLLILVFELLIGATVSILMLAAASQWGTGEAVKRKIIAQDLGLLIAQLESETLPTTIAYPRDLSTYVLQVKGSCVSIGAHLQDPAPAKWCFPASSLVNEGQLIRPKSVFLISDGMGITLSDKKKEFLAPTCPKGTLSGNVLVSPDFTGLNEAQIEALNRARLAFETALGERAVSEMAEPESFGSTRKVSRTAEHTLVLRLSSRAAGVRAHAPAAEVDLACNALSIAEGTLLPGEQLILELPATPTSELGAALGRGAKHAFP